MKLSVERLFTKQYFKEHAPAAAIAAIVAGYGFYTLASGYTYAKAQAKIDTAVNDLIAICIKPVLSAFGAGVGLDTVMAIAISAVEDFGSTVATTIITIPTGHTGTDTIDSGTVQAASILIGAIAGITTYVVIDHLAEDLGIGNAAITSGGF